MILRLRDCAIARFFLLFLLFLAIDCRRKESGENFNLLLVTIDTLRADHLGCYGYGKGETPTLDRLAREGVRFEQAISAAPLTLPSHATILSGALPTRHGLRNNGGGRFPADQPTLATMFSSAGYRTAAFVGAFVLDRRFGLNRGFEVYDDEVERDPTKDVPLEAERNAAAVVDRAGAWLARPDPRPFFAWIHLYDPHAPYSPPEPFRERYGDGSYDGEIAYVDSQLARLLDSVARAGATDKTLVVVVGDHGEGLGEHGENTHGLLVYESTLRVPLIFQAPGLLRPRAIATPVSVADLAPTAASLLKRQIFTEANASYLQFGRDLSALFRERDHTARHIYAETEYPAVFGWSSLGTLRQGNLKLIAGPTPEMYDVAADPGETRNIINDHRRAYRQMTARLTEIRSGAVVAGPTGLDEETQRKLASLGYVGGAPDPNARPLHERPDPREAVGLFTEFEEANRAIFEGKSEIAIEKLSSLVKADPMNAVFRGSLARALRDRRQFDRAITLFREAAAMQPDDAEVWYNLAVTLREAGRGRDAVIALREAIRRDANRPEAFNLLGIVYSAEGNVPKALQSFQRVIEFDPRNARAYNNLGNALRALGRFDQAEEAYQKALTLAPRYADPLNGLGTVEVQRGQPARALSYFDRALALAPDFHEVHLNRGIAYQMIGNRGAAEKEYREFLSVAGKDPAYASQRDIARTLLDRLSKS